MRILDTNQTLTNTFTDIGAVIGPSSIAGSTGDNLIMFSFLTVAVELDINDSEDFQIKALIVDAEDPTKEFDFPINTVKKNIVQVEPLVQEFNLDIDANQTFSWDLDNTVDAIQLQVRAGTVGATAGVITSIRYNIGYRQ